MPSVRELSVSIYVALYEPPKGSEVLCALHCLVVRYFGIPRQPHSTSVEMQHHFCEHVVFGRGNYLPRTALLNAKLIHITVESRGFKAWRNSS